MSDEKDPIETAYTFHLYQMMRSAGKMIADGVPVDDAIRNMVRLMHRSQVWRFAERIQAQTVEGMIARMQAGEDQALTDLIRLQELTPELEERYASYVERLFDETIDATLAELKGNVDEAIQEIIGLEDDYVEGNELSEEDRLEDEMMIQRIHYRAKLGLWKFLINDTEIVRWN